MAIRGSPSIKQRSYPCHAFEAATGARVLTLARTLNGNHLRQEQRGRKRRRGRGVRQRTFFFFFCSSLHCVWLARGVGPRSTGVPWFITRCLFRVVALYVVYGESLRCMCCARSTGGWRSENGARFCMLIWGVGIVEQRSVGGLIIWWIG